MTTPDSDPDDQYEDDCSWFERARARHQAFTRQVDRNVRRLRIILYALVVIAATAIALAAQTVHVHNASTVPFEGWVRCNTDVMPPHRSGIVTSADGFTYRYMLGRPTGLDSRALDVQVRLEPGELLDLDLGKSAAFDATRPPISDLNIWCGGVASIAGKRFTRVDYTADGAGYLVHYRVRTGRMLCTDLWLHWIPEQAFIRGEVLVTCSNPAVEDLDELVPANFTLKIGDAIVLVPGRKANAPLLDAGTHLGDGQARALPLYAFFPRHAYAQRDWSSVGALERVHAVAINQLWPQVGNPRTMPGLNVRQWTEDRVPESVRRLHTFEPALLGPNRRSADTGAQADQVYVGGEALLPGGAGAIWPIYLNALRVSNRPCHHLEADGSLLSMTTHPQLVMWDSRPHWHTGVSPDRLGKPGGQIDFAGWYGGDVEHWFHNNLVAAVRITGSPCLQQLLNMQGRIYPYQHTHDPRLIYQSQPFAARAVGWEGIMATHLWLHLEDRELAARDKDNWLQRAELVLVPQLGSRPGDVWDWSEDPRLGASPGHPRYMPWQLGIGSAGLELAGRVLGHKQAREIGLRAAKAVLRDAYWHDGERWNVRDVVAADGSEVSSGHYHLFGNPCAIATILAFDPAHEPARTIWKQLLNDAGAPHQFAWLSPGVK